MHPENCRIILGDTQQAEELVRQICERYAISQLDRVVLYADTTPVSEILSQLDFLPVSSEKKLVMVKNIEAISKNDWVPLLEYLAHPYQHVLLILTGTRASITLPRGMPVSGTTQKQEISSLFSAVYSNHRLTVSEALKLFRETLEKKEQNFPLLFSAMELHLRKRILREKKDLSYLREFFFRLHYLDLALKTGRLTPEAGLELFLVYLLV